MRESTASPREGRPNLSRAVLTGAVLATALAAGPVASGAVTGRYVYFGNALSEPMGLVEVEVFANGGNVILNRPEVFTAGLDYGYWMIKRKPGQKAQAAKQLVDGDVDTSKRRVDFGSKVGGGYLDITLRYSSLEIDLGKEMPIDSIAIYRSRYTQKQHNDLGWRVLVVLDGERRIVSWEAFNVYGPEWKKNKGCWALNMKPAKGALAKRVVPKGARCWLSEAEYIRDCLGKPVADLVKKITPEQKARLQRFKHRNGPAQIKKLGREFFKLVDLDRPDLKKVKALAKARKYAKALEAFKKPFLDRLDRPFRDWNAGEGTSIYVFYTWTTEPDTRYTGRSRDLKNHIYADRKELTVKRFLPGLLPPTRFEFPMQTRSLLLNYAVSKKQEDLRLWEAMTDDWALGFQEAADEDSAKLRDYFVLTIGMIRKNLKDLYMARQSNPDFVRDLSGATLARFLMPIIEEIPVANWRVARKVSFNHTYNSIPGGLIVSILLDHFHAGQRLGREMQQAFQRLYTYNQYRDGSMVEVGDEGHYLAPVCSPGYLYGNFVHQGRPDWFTPAIETYFLDNYRANILSHVRNLSPCGAHVRWNPKDDKLLFLDYELDIKDPYWRNVCGNRMTWGDYYTKLTLPVLKEPEPRAYVDTVYGRGRPPFENKGKRKEQDAIAKVYGGTYEGIPKTLSDWMPYTGLWYFRGGWDHEASFLHMVKPSNPNNLSGGPWYSLTNTYGPHQFNSTSYRFYDYATPLLTCMGVLVDDLPPCPQEKLFPSGSKQGNFTQAVEKPQSSRWHTDAELDFGEAIYRGNYRDVRLKFDHKLRKSIPYHSDGRVENVETTRQIIQVRPARLFLQVDRIRYANPDETHTNTVKNTMILTEPPRETGKKLSSEQVQIEADKRRTATRNPGNAGVTVAWFGQAKLDIVMNAKSLNHPSASKLGGPSITFNGYRKTTGRMTNTSWIGKGESVLLSVLRAHKRDEEPIKKLDDLSTDSVAGVRATMIDGVKVTFLVARQNSAPLTIGSVSAKGEALLLIEQPGKRPIGLALGTDSLKVAGKRQKLASADVRFDLDKGFRQTEIRRPIDPPTIGPAVNTFSGTTTVSITSKTPEVEIEYIVETMEDSSRSEKVGGSARASVNATNWKPYRRPFTISESTFVRARARRKGVKKIPFASAGTDATAISYGFFHKKAPLPALRRTPANLRPGLNYDYLEDRWFALWTYTNQLDAKKTGTVTKLLDVSMRETDDPFAVRYHGYIDIPSDGVYAFYGPYEYVNNVCEPGYDLRLYIDGKEWYLGQTWHGLGMWSVPLKRGLHRFKLTFADARAKNLEKQRVDLWRHYPWPETTWRGVAPVLEVSGPGLERQPVPEEWLKR